MFLTRRFPRFLLAALMVMAACASPPTGPTAPAEAPNFAQGPDNYSPVIITLADSHSPFFNESVSFLAKAGSSAEGAIYFKDDRGRQGKLYAKLRLSGNSLLSYPDGRPFAKGDAVMITMRIGDGEQILFDMQPSGLRFTSKDPAQLLIGYAEADPDYNHDGVVDALDLAIKETLAIWMQELDQPFSRIASVNFPEADEMVARIAGFSRFAIAY